MAQQAAESTPSPKGNNVAAYSTLSHPFEGTISPTASAPRHCWSVSASPLSVLQQPPSHCQGPGAVGEIVSEGRGS